MEQSTKYQLPQQIIDEYFELAQEIESSGGMMTKLRGFARRKTKELMLDGVHKYDAADAFHALATACYQRARVEKWTSDYALDIADVVRRAAMEARLGR